MILKLSNALIKELNCRKRPYRITNITHTNNENGDYLNRFQAVTAEFDAYPNTNIQAFPKSETQTAVVMENADPEGLGRIRVQFPWQKIMGEMTPWIRIVTPHAGGDKGFHFVPEIDEEVLVGFEGGNAEHPYMLGSLYNGSGKASEFQNNTNDIKAIKTRSGHIIEFKDSDGAESITIKDKNDNIIFIDTAANNMQVYANNNIEITAKETMILSAKNIDINASENINVGAGKNISTSAGENANLFAKNINETADENNISNAKTSEISSDQVTVKSNGKNLTLFSGKSVDVQSNEKVKLF